MKSVFVGLFVASIAFFALSATVWAESDENITQQKIDNIREHCTENQASLNRLRQTDAFLRTDRGNLYRTISDKLMVPLNQRLVANQLDGGRLITTAANFDSEYRRFYQAYIAYANSMSELLAIDCAKRPVSFYDALVEARQKRAELSLTNQSLKKLIIQYGQIFRQSRPIFLKEDA